MINTIVKLTREEAESSYKGMDARLDDDHGPVDDASFCVAYHEEQGETRLTMFSKEISGALGCGYLVYDEDDGWLEVL